jgi:hypothetical protein
VIFQVIDCVRRLAVFHNRYFTMLTAFVNPSGLGIQSLPYVTACPPNPNWSLLWC